MPSTSRLEEPLGNHSEALNLWADRIQYHASRLLRVVSRFWLTGVNTFMGLYVGLPVLAPILQYHGLEGPAGLIHTIFCPLCHQRPERSFFLYGRQWSYSYAELEVQLGGLVPSRYPGDPELGFKVAICERDVAIYGALFLGGLLFHLVRRRLKPLSGRGFLALMLPMAVDGVGQLVGLWTSTTLSRVLTGALFGLATVWLVYPYLQDGMSQVYAEMVASLAARRQPETHDGEVQP
jgi:uncharacterized membrane protein